MTPAGTSNELDVQNGWEENTHTHMVEARSVNVKNTTTIIVLTYGIPPEFRGGVHLFILNRHTPSGQSRVANPARGLLNTGKIISFFSPFCGSLISERMTTGTRDRTYVRK